MEKAKSHLHVGPHYTILSIPHYFRDFSLRAIIKVSNSFSATEIFAAPPQSFAQSYLVVCATSVRLQSDGR